MNNDPQHELHDELLSAYLDDELSPEERALVERQLADDPDARQLLDNLRNVSQAVRELPQQTVARDLRGPVLQKVEATRAAARVSVTPVAAAESSAPMPKLTIGRSARGWVWASLAVAAALFIMFVQSGDDREPPIGGIAQRADEPADDRRKLARGVPELRSGDEPMAPQSAPSPATIDSSAIASRELADIPAPSDPAPSDQFSSVSGAPAEVALGAAPQSAGEAGELSAMPESAAAPVPFAIIDVKEPVVVRVLAKRAALENKSFEKILVNNGIAVEADSPADDAAAKPLADSPPAQSGRVNEQLKEQRSSPEAGCEVMFVEAPPTAIYKCMAELNQDSNNYPGVSVDDSEPADDVSALEVSGAKKLATDLGKYSRGVVPQEFKDAFSRDKAAYYQFDPNGQDARGAQSFFGGRAEFGAGEQEQEQAQAPERKSEMDRGRARRVQPFIVHTRDGAARSDRFSGLAGVETQADALTDRDGLLQSRASGSADSENWQVLFFLCPVDETAPSAPAASRAE